MMSSNSTPVFTYSFITVCVVVFFGCFTLTTPVFLSVLDDYAVQPASFAISSNFISFITYMFIHVDFQHLTSNMFVLLSVGRAVESEIGSTKFGALFLGAGAFSGFAHVLFNQGSEMNVVGASGAVFGAIAVLLLLMPFKFTSALLLPIPGVVLGLTMLAVEITSIMNGNDVFIAHDVHLYGFVAGTIASFGLDYNRALKGLVLSVIVILGLYYWVVYLNGMSI